MPRPVILVVDDDPGVRESFRLILEDHYDVLDVPDGPRALEVVRSAQVDLVLLDIRLPDMDGIEVLERTKAIDEGIEVILVTAVKTVRTAVAAMKLGAFDYLTKPFEEDELLQLVRRALEKRSLEREVAFLRAELARTQESEEIVGQHPAMQKLRRVLQEREIERVGGSRSIKIDVRVVAATNADLKAAMRSGTFREDLYYRLNVVPIEVPPLSERSTDVPLLVDHFVRRYSREFNKRVEGLSHEALAALEEYRWPGNVRELQNVIERCVVLAEGPLVQLNDLPLDVLLPEHRLKVRRAERLPLKQASEQFERQVVLRIMERVKGNQSEAARILGVHRNSLKRMLARWKSS